ncbi:D-2-hydroxyacid dehydrogenase [Sutcliffiella deserti]|uniref:D-2-hydroxyacid dehydrogenase n=1 Tax=Sutcliffiella deserti TaxID=2875501 RepID=UPI001CBCA0AE|nr:D-2-hydroxyacid dehydrogenase [Sutcliffiella deserti]
MKYLLDHHHLQQNFRFLRIEDITSADFAWADAYVGSRPCQNFNLSNLSWVHSFNAGVNNYLEVKGWKENNILLTRTVCNFGQKISEYCLSYILKELQYHHKFQKNQWEKKWEPKTPKMIRDQTIVIYGTGEIGQEIAKTFSSFGAAVYGVSQSGRSKDYFHKVSESTEANSLVSEADWVISTLPLTKKTTNYFNSEFFTNLNNAGFINVGRGATVDEAALIQALDTKKVRCAVLDVVAVEPLPESSSLWGRRDVTITPHISAVTALKEAVHCFSNTLKNIENNEPLINKVDFEKGY